MWRRLHKPRIDCAIIFCTIYHSQQKVKQVKKLNRKTFSPVANSFIVNSTGVPIVSSHHPLFFKLGVDGSDRLGIKESTYADLSPMSV